MEPADCPDASNRPANRRLLTAGAASLAALAVVAGFGPWRSRPASARPVEIRAGEERGADELARERREVSKRALGIIDRSWEIGAPVRDAAGDVHMWSSRLLGTEIYLSMAEGETRVEDAEVYLSLTGIKPNPNRTTAFEQHLARMRSWENRLRRLADQGVMSTIGFLDVESRRIQAELWLARERQKALARD